MRFRSALVVRHAFLGSLLAALSLGQPLHLRGAVPGKSPARSSLTAKSGGSELRGYDLEGGLHRLGERDGCSLVVVAFLSTECPISNAYVPLLNQMAANGRRKGLDVFGVVCGTAVSRSAVIAFRDEYQVKFPILFDASCDLRRQLEPTHTPHVFVLTRDGKTLYQGAIDDRYAAVGRKKLQATENYLTDAVAAAQASRPIATASSTPIGCLLEEMPDPARSNGVTFSRDIAPILFAHCAHCHRPGQAAPFPLLTFDDASRHAKQIVQMTASRLMPPWKPVHGFGKFKDERRLSEREIELIAKWADGGKPQGNDADLPAPPTFSDEWALGKPDLILKMPQAFSLPATGNDVHQHFVLPMKATENRLIAAVEFRPGNPRVVHHACFYLDRSGTGRKLDQADPAPGYGGGGGAGFLPHSTLRSWLPGLTPRRLPEGSGRLMAKGSDLVLELHYQCSGKPETDQSTVAIYYASRKSKQIVSELQILNCNLEIPPGVSAFRHMATYTLDQEAILLDCAPHMHLLGREMKSTATRPDGVVVPLIWIKDWNFQWQEQYEFHQPIRLPKGTRIDVECVFDNSTGNPLNPYSPPRKVTWGEQTKEEMGICHFQFTCDRLDDYIALSRHHAKYRLEQALATPGGRMKLPPENAVNAADLLGLQPGGRPARP